MARYSVVQYLPDPLAEERINIGVVAFDDAGVFVRFSSDWSRLRRFGREDVSFLKLFAAEMQRRSKSFAPLSGDDRVDIEAAEFLKMVGGWSHSIQFTRPRGSVRPAAMLIEELEQRFLSRKPLAKASSIRDRDEARSIVRRVVRKALVERVSPESADHLIRERMAIEGKFGSHNFDLVVANGRPYFAAQALSFEVPRYTDLKKSVEAVAWNLDDVHDLLPDLPLAVIALRPSGNAEHSGRNFDLMRSARKIYESIGAAFVDESEIESWAMKTTENTIDVAQLPLTISDSH